MSPSALDAFSRFIDDILSKVLLWCLSISPEDASLGRQYTEGRLCVFPAVDKEFWGVINHASCGGNQKAVQKYTVTESDLEQRR